jgi:hypothetical protein
MKTLTNESRELFFSKNIGTETIYDFDGRPFRGMKKIEKLTISNFEMIVFSSHRKLIQTPLQKITDEHAIEVAKLYHPGNDRCEVLRKDNKGYFKIDVDSSSSLESSLVIELNFYKAYGTSYSSNIHGGDYNSLINELAHISVYQYLQSKGYAIPYYCPIANRIVTVKEQVSEGWIVLKEE